MEENNLTLNRFIKGVNTDLAEDMIPNGFLSGGHNIKFTNDDNKQGIVQKQESYIKELNGYGANLKPLAAKVFNNVIYIVSFNTVLSEVEYGTYPSADIVSAPPVATNQTRTKVNVYAPLPNFKNELVAIASPAGFYNVDSDSPSQLSTTITTSSGENWTVVTYDSGLTLSSYPAASGTNLTITVDDNTTQFSITRNIIIKSVSGDIITTIPVVQRFGGTPVLDITSVTDKATTTMNVNVTISDDNGAAVTARGVCWNLTGYPDTSDNTTSNGTGTGSYVGAMSGLVSSTKYYIRAYATNSYGTEYSAQAAVTTLDAGPPASGYFSPDTMTDNLGVPHDIIINFTPSGSSTSWSISKISGVASAQFVPDTGTATDTVVAVLTGGTTGNQATFELVDDFSGLQLDTFVATVA